MIPVQSMDNRFLSKSRHSVKSCNQGNLQAFQTRKKPLCPARTRSIIHSGGFNNRKKKAVQYSTILPVTVTQGSRFLAQRPRFQRNKAGLLRKNLAREGLEHMSQDALPGISASKIKHAAPPCMPWFNETLIPRASPECA